MTAAGVAPGFTRPQWWTPQSLVEKVQERAQWWRGEVEPRSRVMRPATPPGRADRLLLLPRRIAAETI